MAALRCARPGQRARAHSPAPAPSRSRSRVVAARARRAPEAAGGIVDAETAEALRSADWPASGRGTALVLIGGRGCGKSSISRRIAASEKRFERLSTDYLMRYEADGKDVADIVAAGGWSGFRDLEYEVARKCCALDEWTLLDCGGGIVVDVAAGEGGDEVYSERKAAALRAAGLVVYVERPVEYLEGRIARKARKEAERTGDSKKGDANRPQLSATSSFAEIMARRDPWYRATADVTLQCAGMKKDEIAKAVMACYTLATGVELAPFVPKAAK